jgi:hypothetical protein
METAVRKQFCPCVERMLHGLRNGGAWERFDFCSECFRYLFHFKELSESLQT